MSNGTRFALNILVIGGGAPAQRADYEGRVVEQLRRLLMFETGHIAAMLEMPALTNALAGVPVTPNLFAQYGTPTNQDLFFGAPF